VHRDRKEVVDSAQTQKNEMELTQHFATQELTRFNEWAEHGTKCASGL